MVSRDGRLLLETLKLVPLFVSMSLVVGGGWSVIFACLRSFILLLWLPNPFDSPFKVSRGSLSGLVLGLLSSLDGANFSFRRLAGEIPRIELEMLFR